MDYTAEWECEEEERVGHGEGLNGEGRSRVVQKLDLGRQSIEIACSPPPPLSSPRFRGGRVKQRGLLPRLY